MLPINHPTVHGPAAVPSPGCPVRLVFVYCLDMAARPDVLSGFADVARYHLPRMNRCAGIWALMSVW
jgi:hypothetical protein